MYLTTERKLRNVLIILLDSAFITRDAQNPVTRRAVIDLENRSRTLVHKVLG